MSSSSNQKQKCPHCQKMIKDVRGHIMRQHPGFTATVNSTELPSNIKTTSNPWELGYLPSPRTDIGSDETMWSPHNPFGLTMPKTVPSIYVGRGKIKTFEITDRSLLRGIINLSSSNQEKSSSSEYVRQETIAQLAQRMYDLQETDNENPELGRVKTSYKHAIHEFGRIIEMLSASLSTVKRSYRHTLCRIIYVDFDFVCCMPTIMLAFAARYQIKCPRLRAYCENPKKLRVEIARHHFPAMCEEKTTVEILKMYNDTAKSLPIRLAFGGTYRQWREDFEIDKSIREMSFVNDLQRELNQLMTLIYNNNPHIRKAYAELRPEKTKSQLKRSINSLFFSSIEKVVQEDATMFLYHAYPTIERGSIVPCQDGMMLRVNDVRDDMLQRVNEYLELKYGYGLTLIDKPFDEAMDDIPRDASINAVPAPNMTEELKRYFDVDTGDIKIITEDSKYLSQEGTPFEDDIFDDSKYLILSSYMGTGKSTAMRRLIDHMFSDELELVWEKEKQVYRRRNDDSNYKSRGVYCNEPPRRSILQVSPRRLFTHHCESCNHFDSYLSIERGPNDCETFICQVESLLAKTSNITYKCILLDEIEEILAQFSSPTMKQHIDTWNLLVNHMQGADKVIIADAYITQRTISFVNSVAGSLSGVTMIRNTTLPSNQTAIIVKDDIMNEVFLHNLSQDKRIYAVFSTKTRMKSVNSMIAKHFKDKKVLVYKGGQGREMKESVFNINTTWAEVDIVLTTPALTVGNSYSPDDKSFWFDCTFAFNFDRSACVRTANQMMWRNRHTKENKIYVSFQESKQIRFKGSKPDELLHELFESRRHADEKQSKIQSIRRYCEKCAKEAYDAGDYVTGNQFTSVFMFSGSDECSNAPVALYDKRSFIHITRPLCQI